MCQLHIMSLAGDHYLLLRLSPLKVAVLAVAAREDADDSQSEVPPLCLQLKLSRWAVSGRVRGFVVSRSVCQLTLLSAVSSARLRMFRPNVMEVLCIAFSFIRAICSHVGSHQANTPSGEFNRQKYI